MHADAALLALTLAVPGPAADTIAFPVPADGAVRAAASCVPPRRCATWTAAAEPYATAPPRLGPDAEPEDRWLAEDKGKHFFMSYAVTVLGYAALRTVGLGGTGAVAGAAGVAAVAGLGKEARDRRSGGRFSVKDLVWDAAGIGAGVAIAVRTR